MRHQLPWAILIIFVASTATARVHIHQTMGVDAQAIQPPVQLAPGPDGSTTIGPSGTNAETMLNLPGGGQGGGGPPGGGGGGPPNIGPPRETLRIQSDTDDWDVHLTIDGAASDLASLNTLTISLDGVPQVEILQSQVVLNGGVEVLLPEGDELMVEANGLVQGPAVVRLEIRMSPAGAAEPVIVYPYALSVS